MCQFSSEDIDIIFDSKFKFSGSEQFEESMGSRLKVDENLNIVGETDVYAIGDCCNTKVFCNVKTNLENMV